MIRLHVEEDKATSLKVQATCGLKTMAATIRKLTMMGSYEDLGLETP